MPIYCYSCTCGRQTEAWRSMDKRNDGPTHCGQTMSLKLVPTMVQADIEPYRTVAADQESGKRLNITSRKQHKEFLKRNGYEELGNEKPKRLANRE